MSFGSAPVAISPEMLAEMDDEEDKARRSSVASLAAELDFRRRNSLTDVKRRFTVDELRGTRSIEFATEFNRRLTQEEMQIQPKIAETGTVESNAVQDISVDFSELAEPEPAIVAESSI